MRFPVREPWKLTSDFRERRPLYLPLEKRTKIHGGWDIKVASGIPFYAPEDGALVFHKIWRSSPKERSNWYHPHDGPWYAFSNYYQDTFGCLLIVYGLSNNTHVFCHVEPDDFYRALFDRHPTYQRIKKKKAYNRWVKAIITLAHPVLVIEGERIGFVGDEGHSQVPHIHLEVHKNKVWGRKDPAIVFPNSWRDHKGDLS